MTPVEKIDILVKNEEYLSMNEAQKLRLENDVIYDDKPITDEYLDSIDTSSANMGVDNFQGFNYSQNSLRDQLGKNSNTTQNTQ